jgi:hypothetical protein
MVLLADMLEFCPAGESATAVFAFLDLQRLPREIWVLLSKDDSADMRAIAEKADRLIAMHVLQSQEACAAVAAEVSSEALYMVAARGSEPQGQGPQAASAASAEGARPVYRPRHEGYEEGPLPSHLYVFLPCQVQQAGQVLRVGVLLARKLGRRGVVAAVRPSRLFFVTDSLSHPRFLVDTGSAFSICRGSQQIAWLAPVSLGQMAAAFPAVVSCPSPSPMAVYLASGCFSLLLSVSPSWGLIFSTIIPGGRCGQSAPLFITTPGQRRRRWVVLRGHGPLTAGDFGTAPPVCASLSQRLLSATSFPFGRCSPPRR